MIKSLFVIIVVFVLAVSALAGGAPPEGHPALQPKVTADSEFPLYDAESLAIHGYPDHQHEYFWPDWTPRVDEAGVPYGYGTFCRGIVSLEREGLQVEPGVLVFDLFELSYNATVEPCYVAPFLGFCEMAQRDVMALLQIEPAEMLKMLNPDDISTYTAMTGYESWRMYRRDGNDVVLQPVGVLAQRTLIAHAARDLVLRWILDANGGEKLPIWFRDGLAAWFAELGVHLNNYMAADRQAGSPLLGPTAINSILGSPPHPDAETDRRMFRQARYSAFLMVWHLVEHRGGLDTLRNFVHAVRDGEEPNAASMRFYGVDMATLSEDLDPRHRAEPLGDNVVSRNPTRPPN